MDIVDQHHRLAAHPFAGMGRDMKGPGYRLRPAPRAHPAQGWRSPDTLKQHRIVRDTRCPRQRPGDQRRLVESARPDTPAVKRNRHEQFSALRHQPRHLPGNRLGKGSAPAIFEPQRDGARDIPVGNGSTNAGMTRRLPMARGTQCARPKIIGERRVASGTPGWAEKAQFPPTGRAEAMVLPRHRTTTGAARRQREIGDNTQRIEKPRHTPLSRRPSDGTSLRGEHP